MTLQFRQWTNATALGCALLLGATGASAAPEHNCDSTADCASNQECHIPSDGPDGGIRPLIDGGFRGWCVDLPPDAGAPPIVDSGQDPTPDAGTPLPADGGTPPPPDAGDDNVNPPPPDSGVPLDSGSSSDSGSEGDADGGPDLNENDPVTDSGACHASTTQTSPLSVLASLFALALWAGRRRRH
jgi:uncharacterized protein (TIGR03382 family)